MFFLLLDVLRPEPGRFCVQNIISAEPEKTRRKTGIIRKKVATGRCLNGRTHKKASAGSFDFPFKTRRFGSGLRQITFFAPDPMRNQLDKTGKRVYI
jgi:hypothetical protein